MGSFMPNLTSLTAPLRDFIKKDAPFIRDVCQQESFERIKSSVTARCATYYCVKKPLILEVDPSVKGLRACLIQSNKPIAYVPKTLIATQSNYGSIEREVLALAHGV